MTQQIKRNSWTLDIPTADEVDTIFRDRDRENTRQYANIIKDRLNNAITAGQRFIDLPHPMPIVIQHELQDLGYKVTEHSPDRQPSYVHVSW